MKQFQPQFRPISTKNIVGRGMDSNLPRQVFKKVFIYLYIIICTKHLCPAINFPKLLIALPLEAKFQRNSSGKQEFTCHIASRQIR